MMPLAQTMTDNCDVHLGDQHCEPDCSQLEPTLAEQQSAAPSLDVSTCTNGDAHLAEQCATVEHLKAFSAHSQQCNFEEPAPQPPECNITASLDDSDEFCDFEAYSQFNGNTIHNVEANVEDEFANFTSCEQGENFANFEQSELSSNEPAVTQPNDAFSDEEFADFKAASQENLSIQSHQKPQASSFDSNTDWSALFKVTFPLLPLTNEQLHESNETLLSTDLFEYGSVQSELLWTSLQSMDLKSICLHRWKDSLSFKRLLQALKVDSNVISSDHIFPKFGQILEPVSVSNWNNHSVQNSAHNNNNNNNNNIENNNFAADIKSKPIVPLDGEFQPALRLNQDLDFFESKYTHSNDTPQYKDDLISQFESIILEDHATKSSEQVKDLSSSSSPVSSATDLRKMLKESISKTNNEQVLSAEALQILTELPNLSFIRAKVLMFPINDKDS